MLPFPRAITLLLTAPLWKLLLGVWYMWKVHIPLFSFFFFFWHFLGHCVLCFFIFAVCPQLISLAFSLHLFRIGIKVPGIHKRVRPILLGITLNRGSIWRMHWKVVSDWRKNLVIPSNSLTYKYTHCTKSVEKLIYNCAISIQKPDIAVGISPDKLSVSYTDMAV